MTPAQIAARRLVHQHLVKPDIATAHDVVAILGAVQAQDYAGAKWAISQRTPGLTDESIETEISAGRIVRTHILRPTWHFVAAEDLGWMLELTAPRVNQANAYSYRRHELDDAIFRKSRRVLTKALADGRHLTRTELATRFARAGIIAKDRQRITHLMMRAELDGVVCSGTRRGKQSTYALVDERIAKPRQLQHDEALAELTQRFFRTRGPATVDDFSWWSGLTKADCRRGVAALGTSLRQQSIEDKTYYSADVERRVRSPGSVAHLLPNYDEYFIGFKDRSALLDRLQRNGHTPKMNGLSGNILTIDGQLVGNWTRAVASDFRVEIRLLDDLSAAERRAVDRIIGKYGDFYGTRASWR